MRAYGDGGHASIGTLLGMVISPWRVLSVMLVAAYFYAGLPVTAAVFYELYHMVGIGALYWAYSGFKAAGYFLGAYEYRVAVCLLSAGIIVLLPALVKNTLRAIKSDGSIRNDNEST